MFVLKRNGTRQEWQQEKMVTSIVNAGVNQKVARLITMLIFECLNDKGSFEIESVYLREKIIAMLRILESNCADAYEYFSTEPQNM